MINIAYIDDQETVRLGVVSLLEKYETVRFVLAAASGHELLDFLNTNQHPDICMLDIQMPEMDGFMLVEAIRSKWPTLPILILTSYDLEHFVIQMIRKGVNGYLLKDCKPAEIVRAIEEINLNGYYYSDKVGEAQVLKIKQKVVPEEEFTELEITFLRLCCSDLNYSEIAKEMNIPSTRTVEWHRDKLFRRFGLNNRIGLVFLAMRYNFVPLDIMYRI